MKNFLLSLLSLFLMFLTLGQEYEYEKIKVKYFKPSYITESLPVTYSTIVVDEVDGSTTLAKDGGNSRENEYFYAYNSVLKGCEMLSEGGEWTVIATTGEAKIVQTEPAKHYNETDPAGNVKSSGWEIKIKIMMPYKLQLKNKEGKIIHEASFPDMTGSFSYPRSLNGTTFARKELVEAAFSKEEVKAECLAKYKLKKHVNNAFGNRSMYKSELQDSKEIFEAKILQLDLKKKEQPPFQDVIALNDRLIEAMDKANDNFKSDSQMNWHTPELKKEFEAVATGLKAIIEAEMAKEEKGEKIRFSNDVLVGLTKNQLWAEFFSSNFAVVEEWAKKFLESDEKTDASTVNGLFSDLRTEWYRINGACKNYSRTYEHCAERMGWE